MRKIHANNPALRNPDFALQVFDQARQPVVWLFISRRLRQSAKAIFEKEDPVAQQHYNTLQRLNAGLIKFEEAEIPRAPNFEAAYMLIAYAIENLLKGLMLAKGIVKFSGPIGKPDATAPTPRYPGGCKATTSVSCTSGPSLKRLSTCICSTR
jgi:hypothetical protein